MTDEHWMGVALSIAHEMVDSGNTPTGSVIVRDGVEIGRGFNRATTDRNPILHAEVVAIQDACAKTGEGNLKGAVLYSTMEPCPMCAWAIQCAGIARVVLGARLVDLDRREMGSYAFDTFMQSTNQSIPLTSGVRKDECVTFRRNWMTRTGRVI